LTFRSGLSPLLRNIKLKRIRNELYQPDTTVLIDFIHLLMMIRLLVWTICCCYYCLVIGFAQDDGDNKNDGNEAYRAFMDQLAQANVDEYVDLPMIAVMGDTSSGKSSLLSMISQVELPSNDEFTTRCPIMLQMRKAPTKSAVIKVIWKDRPAGYNVDFAEKIVEEANWDNLTAYIIEAQQHIIKKQKKEVGRDIVSLELTGPHVENLTVIDLPGIARSHGKGESASLPEDIQSLLVDYLKNPRCVILAILPANVDFHNSQIMAEALNVDPETKRTIPVLTKPDLIDSGAEGSVKELLLGHKTHDFEMGFHMVKCRGQQALNEKMTIEEGLSQEAFYFDNTEPWRNIDDRTLFGIIHLRMKLGELQMRLIRESFASISAEIKAKRDEAMQSRARLGQIPSELNEKIALFGTVKDEYYMTIGPLVLGGGHIRGQRSSHKRKPSADFLLASNKFMEALNASRLASISEVADGVAVVAFVDGDEIKGKVCYIKDGKVYLNSSEPCRTDDDAWWSYSDVYDDYADMLAAIPQSMVRRDPEWIRELIEENRAYGLPIFANTDVFEGIVATLIDEDWTSPSLELLDYASSLMKAAADEYVKGIGEIESLPYFRQFLLIKSSEVVEALKEEARDKVMGFLNRERTPYTQNNDLFENFSKVRSKYLMDDVLNKLSRENGVRLSAGLYVKKSDVEAIVKKAFERDHARSMDDHMAEEIQHALNEYGKIALKRMIDNIPMICVEIMQEFPKRINEALSNVSNEEIDRLLVPPPDKMRAIEEYARKIETLDHGIAAINSLY
jgi:GTPase SAR1 family protein